MCPPIWRARALRPVHTSRYGRCTSQGDSSFAAQVKRTELRYTTPKNATPRTPIQRHLRFPFPSLHIAPGAFAHRRCTDRSSHAVCGAIVLSARAGRAHEDLAQQGHLVGIEAWRVTRRATEDDHFEARHKEESHAARLRRSSSRAQHLRCPIRGCERLPLSREPALSIRTLQRFPWRSFLLLAPMCHDRCPEPGRQLTALAPSSGAKYTV